MNRRDFLRILAASVTVLGMERGDTPAAPEDPDALTDSLSERIERLRKGECRLTFLRPDGRPLANATVHLRHLKHEFLFGCAIPNPSGLLHRLPDEQARATLESRFLQLFNYATTENAAKWVCTEPEERRYTFGDLDAIVAWCEAHNVRLKGHCLVWGTRGPQGIPDWVRPYEGRALRDLLRRRVESLVSRYAGRIPVWDVVNEPLHALWLHDRLGPDYVADALTWAREADPSAQLLVNEYEGLVGKAAEFADLALRLRESGAPLDAIGEQAHDPPLWYSGRALRDALDTLATAGLPIHLTEFTFPSDLRPIVGGPRDSRWTEEAQGLFYEHCYRAFFAHPAVEAITMWALWDGSTWKPAGGILRPDLSPKPAFEALDRLINHEWRTKETLRTDAAGRCSLRAFYGHYEVRLNGGPQSCPISLLRHGPRDLTLTLA